MYVDNLLLTVKEKTLGSKIPHVTKLNCVQSATVHETSFPRQWFFLRFNCEIS